VAGKAMNAQITGLQQRGRRAMDFFSGLDVGLDETATCVVDDKGNVLLQTTVVTDPDAIKLPLQPYLGDCGGRVMKQHHCHDCCIRNC
jgi:hypothetical protein